MLLAIHKLFILVLVSTVSDLSTLLGLERAKVFTVLSDGLRIMIDTEDLVFDHGLLLGGHRGLLSINEIKFIFMFIKSQLIILLSLNFYH